MEERHLAWSVPVMRVGFAGRGLVYLVVAGFSLYAVCRGARPQGTASALSLLETTSWGSVVLLLIFLGTLAFAVWNVVDALYDLDNRGTDAKGMVARAGKFVTAAIYGAIGGLAFSLLFTGNSRAGGSSASRWTEAVMEWPGGRWIVGVVGLVIVGTGCVFIVTGWKEKYREHLRANRFTANWNWLLKAGVVARGIVIAVIGVLFVEAALQANPGKAGGTAKAFSWLIDQPYGQVLAAAICIGLIAFALFCFVNAAYQIVPKVRGPNIETLASRLASKVREAT